MKGKKLKLLTEILAIIVICLVSFVGVYKQEANKMENQVKGYDFTKDLSGYRMLVFEVSDATEVTDAEGKVLGNTDEYSDSTIETNSYVKTENKINPSESLTIDNFKKAKKIIETRLDGFGVYDYNISLDEENGKIYLQIPENSSTDHTISNILQVANFAIKDSKDTSNIFISNENLKDAKAVYNTDTSGTTVYLQIELDKAGKDKLKELSSGEYKTVEQSEENQNNTEDQNNTENQNNIEDQNAVEGETTVSTDEESGSEESTSDGEETEKEEEDNQKKVILSVDSNDMITTSFDTPIEDGIIDLSMSAASKDSGTISQALQSTSTIGLVLKSGKMPITYKVSENRYVNTDITNDYLKMAIYIVLAVVAIAIVFLIIKFKLRGLIASIAFFGFLALNLLLIRYTNVYISLESIVAGIVIIGINYYITYNITKLNDSDRELKKIALNENIKSTIFKLVPVMIIAVVFSFMEFTKVATFGMIMFWGIVLSVIYNYILTKDMLD